LLAAFWGTVCLAVLRRVTRGLTTSTSFLAILGLLRRVPMVVGRLIIGYVIFRGAVDSQHDFHGDVEISAGILRANGAGVLAFADTAGRGFATSMLVMDHLCR
jgi:hypothetical protein